MLTSVKVRAQSCHPRPTLKVAINRRAYGESGSRSRALNQRSNVCQAE